ncbi:MAG: hypothetical protein IJL26_12455 [Clostridia bacterium]|nr:hypothetical protein [Clostridia bacterium]
MPDFHFGLGIDKNLHIADSIDEASESSPLVRLPELGRRYGAMGELLGKADFLLPQARTDALSAADGADMSASEREKRVFQLSLAPELLHQTYGKLGAVAICCDSPESVTAFAALLHAYHEDIRVIAAVPLGAGAPVGADDFVEVSDENSARMAREVKSSDGLSVGPRSGAALFAAVKAAGDKKLKGKNVIAILTDREE